MVCNVAFMAITSSVAVENQATDGRAAELYESSRGALLSIPPYLLATELLNTSADHAIPLRTNY